MISTQFYTHPKIFTNHPRTSFVSSPCYKRGWSLKDFDVLASMPVPKQTRLDPITNKQRRLAPITDNTTSRHVSCRGWQVKFEARKVLFKDQFLDRTICNGTSGWLKDLSLSAFNYCIVSASHIESIYAQKYLIHIFGDHKNLVDCQIQKIPKILVLIPSKSAKPLFNTKTHGCYIVQISEDTINPFIQDAAAHL